MMLEDLIGINSIVGRCCELQLKARTLSSWEVETLKQAPEIVARKSSRGDEQGLITDS
jgi:hypothetical protein